MAYFEHRFYFILIYFVTFMYGIEFFLFISLNLSLKSRAIKSKLVSSMTQTQKIKHRTPSQTNKHIIFTQLRSSVVRI